MKNVATPVGDLNQRGGFALHLHRVAVGALVISAGVSIMLLFLAESPEDPLVHGWALVAGSPITLVAFDSVRSATGLGHEGALPYAFLVSVPTWIAGLFGLDWAARHWSGRAGGKAGNVAKRVASIFLLMTCVPVVLTLPYLFAPSS